MAKSPKKSNKKKGSSPTAAKLEEYLKIMEAENLQELEVSEGGFQVRLVRQGSGIVPIPLASSPASSAGSESQPKPSFEGGTPITAPLAGVFYRSPSPASPSFVSAGDTVTPGKVLCIIEAMKVMNEVTAEKSGRIKKILVENGKPVEADQVLFILDEV